MSDGTDKPIDWFKVAENYADQIAALNAENARLTAVLVAARDLADLELSEQVPASWATEWAALTAALAAFREREREGANG